MPMLCGSVTLSQLRVATPSPVKAELSPTAVPSMHVATAARLAEDMEVIVSLTNECQLDAYRSN